MKPPRSRTFPHDTPDSVFTLYRKTEMTQTATFYGASDDLIEVEGVKGGDEFSSEISNSSITSTPEGEKP
jgi:hypothetical protein